jgi:hypothetical protein
MQGRVSSSAQIEIKPSIEGKTLDKCWRSNNDIGEQQLITKGPAIKLRTMGSGAGW